VDIVWVRIRSMHAILTPTRVPDRYVTLCGRTASGDTNDDLGAGKSCETCLRIVARKADTFHAVNVPAGDHITL
jgi:hypothetical protein